uniref:hypothetical protein n=1 Tax=[Ruminococcus] torques TaxID=33039 RepID=UPI003AB29207
PCIFIAIGKKSDANINETSDVGKYVIIKLIMIQMIIGTTMNNNATMRHALLDILITSSPFP